jgi:hypothetical protein
MSPTNPFMKPERMHVAYQEAVKSKSLERKPLPSLNWILGVQAAMILGFVSTISNAIFSDPSWLVGVWIYPLVFFTYWHLYKKQIVKRREVRAHNYKVWLNKEVPELAKQESWANIERAYEALMKVGREPTYERAEDWLRQERYTREEGEKWTREAVLPVELNLSEAETMLKAAQDSIAAVYRIPPPIIHEMYEQNRRRAVMVSDEEACQHQNLESVIDDSFFGPENPQQVLFVCSDCGGHGYVDLYSHEAKWNPARRKPR